MVAVIYIFLVTPPHNVFLYKYSVSTVIGVCATKKRQNDRKGRYMYNGTFLRKFQNSSNRSHRGPQKAQFLNVFREIYQNVFSIM